MTSPTNAAVTLAFLIMVKLTCGFTVMFVPFWEVAFVSVELTAAIFESVPLVMTLTTNQTLKLVPFSTFGIIHVNLPSARSLSSYALINLNALSSSSTISTSVALERP